jgi:hypothetical protein
LARVVVEHVGMLVEPRGQTVEVRRPAGEVADRVQHELPLGDAEAPQGLVEELITSASMAGSVEPIASTEAASFASVLWGAA